MRVAIQTISWGPHPADLKAMLSQIKQAEYVGVEFAQHPEQLGDVETLRRVLADLELTCIGMAGGSLAERIEFVKKYTAAERTSSSGIVSRGRGKGQRDARDDRLPYVYLDEWEGMSPDEALQTGATLAIHPHMFKQIQTASDAEEWLERYPELVFLPDTAHLAVAGDDVIHSLDRNYKRIVAIHLKDWKAEFGRAYQFYSRGFVELGEGAEGGDGDVPLDETVKYLKQQRDYHGWLVVEQDLTEDPVQSAVKSREWLSRHGI